MRRRALRARLIVAGSCLVISMFVATIPASAFEAQVPHTAVQLVQLSADPFANDGDQHHTQVEPDSSAFGSTIVTVFQSGRSYYGGSSDIGWATSTNRGATWSHGFLVGLTKRASGRKYDWVSDPAVAYDVRHGVWLISSLALTSSRPMQPTAPAVLVSRSTNGGTSWSRHPVTAVTGTSLDKDWISCDTAPQSPFYGNCYMEYSDVAAGVLRMVTSTDGGQTWRQAAAPRCAVVGGVPVVQPNGTVVVPIHSNGGTCGDQIEAFVSTDGGTRYTGPYKIATTVPAGGLPGTHHIDAGFLRSGDLPTATVGRSGRVYVAWSDCRFRANCATNDLAMSSSIDGRHWTPVSRIRIPGESRTADHFIPGLAADPSVSNGPAHLALAYYDYPIADCSASSCLLNVAMITSADAGATWTRPTMLAGPMKVAWLANTDQGRMVGDYISTSYSGGIPFPMFALARPPNGRGVFDESMYTVRTYG